MKKIIIAALLILTCAAVAMGAGSIEFTKDKGTPIQGFALDATKSLSLALKSYTVDVSKDMAWQLFCPAAADCKVRIMPTSAKGTYPQITINAGDRLNAVVGKNSSFVNFSSAGKLWRQ
jgi:hypothetical protein